MRELQLVLPLLQLAAALPAAGGAGRSLEEESTLNR